MTRMFVAGAVVALALVGSYEPRTFAADQKVVRGTVTAVASNSVTISAGTQEMKFAVDANTHVEATGAGTKSRAARAAGKSGPQVTELIKSGQAVEVSYGESNGALHATRIRAIAKVAAPDPSGASEAQGKVTAISATSLTISGTSGPAKFNQTYTIDANTHVVGKGAGTATAAKGGRTAITDLVSIGDSVTVSYRPITDALHATEIRVVGR